MLRKITTPAVLVSAALLLCGFKPFTEVRNVCPKCVDPKVDTVTLGSGQEIRCTIVAQNSEHYVLERFGEYRAVPKSEISSVEWRSAEKVKPAPGDQVVFDDGLVLHGKITREEPGRYVIIQVGKHDHAAWFGQIRGLYKNGAPQPLP